MKKSRLNLFKSTSMLISILGVLLIVSTAIIAAYIGISIISSGISSEISSGDQYDELAALKSNYSDLESKFNSKKPTAYSNSSKLSEEEFVNGELELLRAKSAIDDVESALKANKPAEEIDNRLKIAKDKLIVASRAYNNL